MCEHQVPNLVFFNNYEVHSNSSQSSHLTLLAHTSGGIQSEVATSLSPTKAAQVRHKGVNPFTLCPISKSPSKLLSKTWLGLTVTILALSLFLLPLLCYLLACLHPICQILSGLLCLVFDHLSLQYFGCIGPVISTQPFSKTGH